MKSEPNAGVMPADGGPSRAFAALFGVFLGLTLLKFGNPAVMDKMIEWPTNGYEWLIGSWPVVIGYWLLFGVAVVGILSARWEIGVSKWLVVLPLIWLGWQFVSGMRTVSPTLTAATLKHFVACAVCFYLGLFCLSRVRDLALFWFGLLIGFVLVLGIGLDQHFGGLVETRRYFWLYLYPDLKEVPPELLVRMSSNRIFSTLVYANALAGVLLLCLPVLLAFIWGLKRKFTFGARVLLLALLGVPALACLFWSGSKGGWLLMLAMGLVALLHLPFAQKWKLLLVAAVLVVGLAGFVARFSDYFRKGATSVSARFDYWQAAARTATAKPVFGTGPGTFAVPYQKIKRPESEMARLTHNDYLEQASDSGIVGFIAYMGFIVGVLLYGKPKPVTGEGLLPFSVWLGLLGWELQSAVEFGLYIPALAWCGFGLMGWLVGVSGKRIDKPASAC